MEPERKAKPYEFREGTLYVALYAAELKLEGRWMQEKVVSIPALAISSHPEFKYRTGPGAIKIRGRLYQVHTGRRATERHTSRDGRVRTWTGDHRMSYNQFINDNDLPVGWDSATSKRLDVMVDEACERFAVDVPDWQSLSVRLAVEGLRDKAQGEINRLQAELLTAGEKRDRLAAVLDLDVIPDKAIAGRDVDRR